MRSVAVLGTLTRDTTVYHDGSRSENWGGIHYSVLTLVSLLGEGDRVVPVANVGRDVWPALGAALQYPNLDLSCLRPVPEPNNHVHLRYTTPEDRDEVLVGLVRPVELAHALGAADCDGYIVNLTSGRDIERDTLEALRARRRGPLQLDVHSLTLDFEPDGRRVLRKPPDWQDWVRCVDWVQMNLDECRLLGDGLPPESLARRVLELGPEGVLVTRGRLGVLGVFRSGGAVQAVERPAARHPQPAYPTGCGDVFGAAFAWARLFDVEPSRALDVANRIAGEKACFEPDHELLRLRERLRDDLRRAIPEAFEPT